MRTLNNTMICWNVGGPVKLVAWPDERRKWHGFEYQNGGSNHDVSKMTLDAAVEWVAGLAVRLAKEYRVRPEIVHRTLREIYEYERAISYGMVPDWITKAKAVEE